MEEDFREANSYSLPNVGTEIDPGKEKLTEGEVTKAISQSE